MDERQVNKKLWIVPGWEFKLYPSRDWIEQKLIYWYTVKDTYFLKASGEDDFCRYLIFRKAVA